MNIMQEGALDPHKPITQSKAAAILTPVYTWNLNKNSVIYLL